MAYRYIYIILIILLQSKKIVLKINFVHLNIAKYKKISLYRGGGTSFFPVKHEKFPLSYIQDAKNFSVVKPLISGEARASLASPVPPPLYIGIYYSEL